MTKVNGWNNYETWNFMLHEGDYLEEIVTEELQEIEALHELNENVIIDIIEVTVVSHIESIEDEALTNTFGFVTDILTASFNEIDSIEIAKALYNKIVKP